jgi:hypothetical protein
MATNPHIYVSSVHGTNTGASDTSFASQQTGLMTSLTDTDVYDNLESAIAGAAPTDGDTIYIADNHAASYTAGTITDIGGGTKGGSGIRIISVDASNIDQYKPGASESRGSNELSCNEVGAMYGVDTTTTDNIITTFGADSEVYLQDCTCTNDSTGDYFFSVSNDNATCRLVNVTLTNSAGAGDAFIITKGSTLFWDGGVLTNDADSFIKSGYAVAGGGAFYGKGLDISSYNGTLLPAAATSTGNFLFRIENCELNSGVTLHGTLLSPRQRFEMFNCDDSAGVFHRFYVASGSGAAQNNDSTYVTATESWYEGSDKSSIEVTTTSACSHVKPFIFELPAQYVDLSQAASDVITIDLVTDSTAVSLTDTDIAAFLVYPDGTTAVQANWVTSGKTVGTGNYGIDPLAAGTALSASSLGAGDWTGEPASANFYKMELNTSGDAGQATAVSIRIEIYKASIASGDLFIHPLLTLS